MKATIEISDSILKKAKNLAREQHVTLRSFTEEGVKRVIEERTARPRKSVTPVTFRGDGLSPAFRDATWQRIRDAAYEGHGTKVTDDQ
jgi:hypothetical protein